MRLLLLLLFCLLSYSCISQVNNESTIAEYYHSGESDIAIFPANSSELFPGTERFTPNREEIKKAENALMTRLAELNSDLQNQFDTPVIHKNLKKYKRQYFGYIDENGKRILFINCLWKNVKESEQLWLKERIMVLDGGSYYWNVKFNLDKDELFDLNVNGDT